jgi:hypothetical protein
LVSNINSRSGECRNDLFEPYQKANFMIDNRTFGHEVHPKVDQFLEYNAVERDSGQFKWVYFLMLAFVILVMARLTLAKKLRVRVTGRHKKDDTLSFGRFPRNKFRDS